MRTRLIFVSAVSAIVLLAGPLLGCSSAGSGPTPIPSVTPSRTPSTTVSPRGLVPLWPFTTLDQVSAWQGTYRSGAQQAWHLDADRTALAFAREHLRYTEIDRITTRSVDGPDAEIGVGWNDDNGTPHTVGVLHLVRFGAGLDAPWVVVGSEDTYLTLTTPRYGAAVRSPLTVGGEITGVDESLRVVVLAPTSATPLAEVTGLPAGGEKTPWTTTLRFSSGPAAPSGTALTIAVSTGGHVRGVERFAITAVRTSEPTGGSRPGGMGRCAGWDDERRCPVPRPSSTRSRPTTIRTRSSTPSPRGPPGRASSSTRPRPRRSSSW